MSVKKPEYYEMKWHTDFEVNGKDLGELSWCYGLCSLVLYSFYVSVTTTALASS